MAHYNECWIKHFQSNSWVGCQANNILDVSCGLSQSGWSIAPFCKDRSRLPQNFNSSTWVWGLWANPLLSGVHSRTGLLLAPRKHSDTETHSRMSGRGHLWSTHFNYAQRSARRHCGVSPEQGPYPACAPHSRPRTGSVVLASSRLSLWDSLGCVALDKGKQSPIRMSTWTNRIL